MANVVINEWIEEYESLTESEIFTYSVEQQHNIEVTLAIYEILFEPYKYKDTSLVDSICIQLLNFYRSGEEPLKKFSMQFIPTLIFLNLSDKSLMSVQTLLISFYNLEIIDIKDNPRTLSFRIPSIAQSSIYHDSNNLEPAFVAENSLRRLEDCNTKLVSWGPLPQIERLNAQNRQRVATALLFLYNQQISNVSTPSIEYTCKIISRLVSQGFDYCDKIQSPINEDRNNFNQHITYRIPVTIHLLLELLHVVYYALRKDTNGSVQALNDIIQRANYETYSEVLLTANAIKNQLNNSPYVTVSTRPSQTYISKSMITNASFRTKKLPDDIPIQDDIQGNELPLDSITEEVEESDKVKSLNSTLKHLLPALGRKHKKSIAGGNEVELTSAGDQALDNLPSELNHTLHVSAV